MATKTQEIKETTLANTKLNVVPLDWKEVYYSNCPLISASNVDQELGWTKSEFKKIGVNYLYLRARKENDWYPHYIHNLDNMIRFGGLFPPVQVHADIRRTRLLGVTHAPREGGVLMVRVGDDLFRMTDLKGKKIGLSKSMNRIKNDWWRIQEHQGIELMLRLNGMTMDDIQLVEFPYADDWYNDPKMMGPEMENPSELWLKRDHKHDLAFRPLEAEKAEARAFHSVSSVASCSSRLFLMLLLAACAAPIGADRVSTRQAYAQVEANALRTGNPGAVTVAILHRYDLDRLAERQPEEAVRKLHEKALATASSLTGVPMWILWRASSL